MRIKLLPIIFLLGSCITTPIQKLIKLVIEPNYINKVVWQLFDLITVDKFKNVVRENKARNYVDGKKHLK